MKIIADENIPCARQAFASLGEVTLLPGRGMRHEQVRDADILLVRSVTRVDRALLEGSRVRFVGSATIGFDHVDRDYLQAQGIGFSTAPGSNATSAAEYVVSALMVLAERRGLDLADMSTGIIGGGNVGSRVRRRLEALGMHCLVNDPPLRAQGGHDDFVDLERVLQTDVISVHVPLTRSGPHSTFHLVNAGFLARLKPGAVFINTARGSVADNAALDELLKHRKDLAVVLDVWEGEPAINTGLLEKVDLGTPHIAGYSLDGKLRGTEMIYRAACEFLGVPAQWSAAAELPPGPLLDLAGGGLDAARDAVLQCYDVRADDARLRQSLALPSNERAACFDRLRKEYPVRREFAETRLRVARLDAPLEQLLKGLGFTVRPNG